MIKYDDFNVETNSIKKDTINKGMKIIKAKKTTTNKSKILFNFFSF